MTQPAGTLEGETGIQNKHINAASITIHSQAFPESTIFSLTVFHFLPWLNLLKKKKKKI